MLEGEGLAEPIADTGLFPRAAMQMMRVGEDTGTLDIQLENAAEYYGRELEYKLKRLTSLFEPAVIIFMGLIVGFVAVALDLGDVRHLQLLEAAQHDAEEVTRRTLRPARYGPLGPYRQGRDRPSQRTDRAGRRAPRIRKDASEC